MKKDKLNECWMDWCEREAECKVTEGVEVCGRCKVALSRCRNNPKMWLKILRKYAMVKLVVGKMVEEDNED